MDCCGVNLTVVWDAEKQSSDSSPTLQQMQLCADSPPGAGCCYVPWLALMQGDPCSPQRNSYQLLVLDFSSHRDITDRRAVLSVPLVASTTAARWNDWIVRYWQRLMMLPRRRWMQPPSKHTVTTWMKGSLESCWAFKRIILNSYRYKISNCGSHVTNGLIRHKNSERLIKQRKVFCVSVTSTLTSACSPSRKWHLILISFP